MNIKKLSIIFFHISLICIGIYAQTTNNQEIKDGSLLNENVKTIFRIAKISTELNIGKNTDKIILTDTSQYLNATATEYSEKIRTFYKIRNECYLLGIRDSSYGKIDYTYNIYCKKEFGKRIIKELKDEGFLSETIHFLWLRGHEKDQSFTRFKKNKMAINYSEDQINNNGYKEQIAEKYLDSSFCLFETR
jgi:hypothetical protein